MADRIAHADEVFGVRRRIWRVTVKAVADAPTDRVLTAMLAVQKTRDWVEDVQDGALHFASLPTRRDLRRLKRQVAGLRQRADALETAVAGLESALLRSTGQGSTEGQD